jgi:hypothetical protein
MTSDRDSRKLAPAELLILYLHESRVTVSAILGFTMMSKHEPENSDIVLHQSSTFPARQAYKRLNKFAPNVDAYLAESRR